MLITKLKLNFFGKFQDHEVDLKPGINLIYGDNEAGKSTIHIFIRGMLFGIERLRGRGSASKEDTYTRYLPWDYPGAYGGSMDIIIGEKGYRLQRSFHANDKNFTITELLTGREVKLKEGMISELVPGLTESTFKNTLSIEQLKASTDVELAAQVRNYIANLSIARNKEIDVTKAISVLMDQKKQLDPAQNLLVLKALQTQLEEGIEKENTIDQLTLQLKELLLQEQELKRQKELMTNSLYHEDSSKIEQFPAILEKHRTYLDQTKQTEVLEQRENELQLFINSLEKEQNLASTLKEAIQETERLSLEWRRLEQQELALRQEPAVSTNTINPFAISLPISCFAFLIFIIFDFQLLGMVLGCILLGIGVLFHNVLNKNRKQRLFHKKEELAEIGEKMNLIKGRLVEIQRKYQVNSVEELVLKKEEILKNYYTLQNARQQKAEVDQRKKKLEDNRDLLYETIMKYMQYFIREEELTQLAMQRLQEEIRRRKLELQGKLAGVSKDYDECKLLIEKLRWKIGTMEGNEELLLRNREQYAQLEKQIKDNSIEVEAIKLALQTIQELSTNIHDTFGQQINQAVSEVMNEVTGQRYNDLKVDEKLDVKVGWKGNYVMLDRLSAGTIDQIYFSLRLAVADLLLGKDEVPLLLDDSFALYDETRVKAALTKISQRNQVLLFTCHRREEMILKELGLCYHLVDLTCR